MKDRTVQQPESIQSMLMQSPTSLSRQTIETKPTIAYETGIAIATESNIAYHDSMQGHSPELHDTSV